MRCFICYIMLIAVVLITFIDDCINQFHLYAIKTIYSLLIQFSFTSMFSLVTKTFMIDHLDY